VFVASLTVLIYYHRLSHFLNFQGSQELSSTFFRACASQASSFPVPAHITITQVGRQLSSSRPQRISVTRPTPSSQTWSRGPPSQSQCRRARTSPLHPLRPLEEALLNVHRLGIADHQHLVGLGPLGCALGLKGLVSSTRACMPSKLAEAPSHAGAPDSWAKWVALGQCAAGSHLDH
jgi:hypothetical protein